MFIDWEIQMQHTFKEGNNAINWLENYGFIMNPLHRNGWIIDDPPRNLFLILYFDLIGLTLPC